MMRNALRAVLAMAVLAALTGLAYPLAMTGLAQIAFGDEADGSLLRVDGRIVGSSLIGQEWKGPGWFYGRPSAAGGDASASSGSNLGPTSRALADEDRRRVAAILQLERPYRPALRPSDIPVDLLTASASGLDPHISPAAAHFQAPRIAAARQLPLNRVEASIDQLTEGRTLGFLGEPRVNVLDLNLTLERLAP